jgi:hypothetical protein
MSRLGLSRLLFRTAARLNDAEIYASGNPSRILKHLVRKAAHRAVARGLRRVLR